MLDYTYYLRIKEYLKEHPWDSDLHPFRKLSAVDIRRMQMLPVTSKDTASNIICCAIQHGKHILVVQFEASEEQVYVKMAKAIVMK